MLRLPRHPTTPYVYLCPKDEVTIMSQNSLATFGQAVRRDWGPLSTEVIASVRGHIERLLLAPSTEDWLEDLRRNVPLNKELLRDPQHGFVLQAHTEPAGLYRPPHDHGLSWVIYAVLEGESEMGTYGRCAEADGTTRLVKRDATRMRAGQVQVYLPGDIHDTLCITGPTLLYRFTERDLRMEDREHHRLTRFIERDGVWVAP
jgi:hypothetical protein